MFGYSINGSSKNKKKRGCEMKKNKIGKGQVESAKASGPPFGGLKNVSGMKGAKVKPPKALKKGK